MNKADFNLWGLKSISTCLLLISTIVALAQAPAGEKILKGVVVDAATHLPISAAQISVPDKNVSAMTNDKGEFSLRITSENDILHVGAIGYALREVALQGRRSMKIELYKAGYTNYYKNLQGLTGVVSNSKKTASMIVADAIEYTSALVVDDVLQGELMGNVRSISRSGLAGMGSSIYIRGVNSINANAQPLFVVDGVIWDNFQNVSSIHGGHFSNPLDNIDISDVDNITVIKDGTSIYGSKGSNGVIIINTKRARSMVTKINLNVFTGTTNVPGSLPMMQGEQFRIYASDLLGGMGYSQSDISSVGFLITDPNNPVYNTYQNNTDWNRSVYQQGLTQSYLINVTGGDEKALYYFSLGLSDNQGVVKSTDWQRINARFNADFKLTNDLSLGLNIGFTRNERRLMDDGIDYFSSPTWMARVKSPFLSVNSFTSFGEKTLNYATTDIFNIGNPAALIDYSVNFQKKYRFNITALPSLQITPDLKISSHFDYSLYKTIEGHFIPERFTPIRFLDNKGYSRNKISSQVMRNTNVFSNTFATYEKKFDLYHYIKAIAGIRFISNYLESDYAEEHNSGSNNNTTITGAYDYLYVTGLNNRSKSLSNYYNVEYVFDNRFFVNGTLSFDASSRFGRRTDEGIVLPTFKRDKASGDIIKTSRSVAVFPAIQGGWLISSEEFMRNIEAINMLKLRAGYGMTGNDGIQDYESMAYFSPIRFIERANGLVLGNLENTKVQWETTGKANIGVDFGLFADRLNVFVDLYSSNTTNLLTLQSLPEIAGLGYFWSNGGSMTNKGYEISTVSKIINTKTIQWEIGTSVGSYRNMVTSLPGDKSITTRVLGGEALTAVGQPLGVFYGYKTNGVFATQAAADNAGLKILNNDGSFTQFGAGDMIFEEVVQDGIIDANDRQVIGNPHPDFYGNVNSMLKYKRFTFSTVFTYSYGNEIYNYFRSQLEAGTDFSNQTSAMLRRWTGEGQVTSIPKSVYGDPMGNARFSDRWIEDGSYVKWKNLTVAYELPVRGNFIEGVNVWASAENLHTWSRYLGIDPEVSAGNSVYMQGVDAGLLPQTRSYFIGVKLNL